MSTSMSNTALPKALLAGGLCLLLWTVAPEARAQARAPASAGAGDAAIAVLPFEQLEQRAARELPDITTLEVHDLLLKVKGHDARGLKVELLMDRRDGQILSRKIKYPKHARGYPATGDGASVPVPRAAR